MSSNQIIGELPRENRVFFLLTYDGDDVRLSKGPDDHTKSFRYRILRSDVTHSMRTNTATNLSFFHFQSTRLK